MKRRDLSAFETPTPAARENLQRARASMTRITLSLPTPVAERLRRDATRRAVGYRAVIGEAVESHGDQVVELTQFPPGRTQVPLNLPADELLVVDRSASRSGANRSQFVTECLLRHWSDSPEGPLVPM